MKNLLVGGGAKQQPPPGMNNETYGYRCFPKPKQHPLFPNVYGATLLKMERRMDVLDPQENQNMCVWTGSFLRCKRKVFSFHQAAALQ